jgi:hypothetical protein
MGMNNISRLSRAKTRSISAENFTGEKGKAAMATEGRGAHAAKELGQGWKVSPCITIGPGETATLAEITDQGAIQHIWCTVHPDWWRRLVLRVYWDGEPEPSIETPLGDFFCSGWCKRCNISSLPVAVNPAGGFNSYWEMPFRKSARITVENLWEEECRGFYYQVDYTLTEVPEDAAYFHAQFRRANPLPYAVEHVLLDGVKGWGQYVGTYAAIQPNSNKWWGEGEIKFYLDGDGQFPTICGTGTEDYFGGAWNWEHPQGQYGVYSTPYLGMCQVLGIGEPDMYQQNPRFGMYRWHIPDPIRFEEDIRVTLQLLGWKVGGRYHPLHADISTTVFWFQTEPHASFPALPDRNGLEIV